MKIAFAVCLTIWLLALAFLISPITNQTYYVFEGAQIIDDHDLGVMLVEAFKQKDSTYNKPPHFDIKNYGNRNFVKYRFELIERNTEIFNKYPYKETKHKEVTTFYMELSILLCTGSLTLIFGINFFK